jgi:tRNA(fMet)-specific endonuclease VapC
MRYLLDSNAWIVHFRQSTLEVTRRLSLYPANDILLCSIVIGELPFGVERCPISHRAANQVLVDDLRQQYQSLPFDDAAAIEYAIIRVDLTARGLMIGGNDLQIAAIARTNGLTLVTHNITEFSRVPGLLIEDWQIP